MMTNNQVFLDFLAQLRSCCLDRDDIAAFQSVILAGVHDVKNIRRKIRPEEEHKINSISTIFTATAPSRLTRLRGAGDFCCSFARSSTAREIAVGARTLVEAVV